MFVYQRFDPKWLIKKIETHESIKTIIEEEWPSFLVRPLKIPEDFELLVGWTKESASTSKMIKQLNEWKDSGNQKEYKRIYDNIADLVRKLIKAWEENDKNKILEYIRKNEEYLRELGDKSGVNIETEMLKLLSETANNLGGAGKLSGAGGGDCGIAICFDKETANKIKHAWENHGIIPLDVKIGVNGINIC